MRILIIFITWTAVCVASLPSSDSIIEPYVAAHKARDIDGLMTLVEISSDTPAKIIDQTKASLVSVRPGAS